MIADHVREIEYLRARVAALLAEKPPKRSRAKMIGLRLNRMIQLQLKRENKIVKRLHDTKQHQASRCRPNPILGASPPGEGGGGSPDARSV
jgi:hypothetical protein